MEVRFILILLLLSIYITCRENHITNTNLLNL